MHFNHYFNLIYLHNQEPVEWIAPKPGMRVALEVLTYLKTLLEYYQNANAAPYSYFDVDRFVVEEFDFASNLFFVNQAFSVDWAQGDCVVEANRRWWTTKMPISASAQMSMDFNEEPTWPGTGTPKEDDVLAYSSPVIAPVDDIVFVDKACYNCLRYEVRVPEHTPGLCSLCQKELK